MMSRNFDGIYYETSPTEKSNLSYQIRFCRLQGGIYRVYSLSSLRVMMFREHLKSIYESSGLVVEFDLIVFGEISLRLPTLVGENLVRELKHE